MLRAAAALAVALLAAGCGRMDQQFYAGERLPPEREVRVVGSGAFITAVDGEKADLKRDGVARLAPGPHVVEVRFGEASGNAVYTTEAMPIPFLGEPGKAYVAYGVAVNDHFYCRIFPADRDPVAAGDIPNVATGRERYRSMVVSRGARVGRGQRSVSGVALIARGPQWFDTPVAREVLLVRRNEASERWIGRVDQKPVPLGPLGLLIAGGQIAYSARPDELAADTVTVKTAGLGGFTFYDVEPGRYYVLYRDFMRAAVAEVDVGATDVVGVRLVVSQ